MDEDERALLAALAEGARVRRRNGNWSAGARRFSGEAVRALTKQGHARIEGDELLVTQAGRAGAALRAPRRLLVERALPQDGEARGSASREARARSITVNLAESPLGWLKARGLVSSRQEEAGERLRGDWTRAGLAPHVTMRWDAAPMAASRGGGGALDATLAQIAAKRRFEAAIDAVGPGLKDVLWRTACAGEGMETAEAALGWPRRTARVVLGIALDRLADHYRLP